MTPLLEIRLELVPPNIHFVPDFAFITDMIDGWMDEFLKVFGVVRRLDGTDADYVPEVLADNSVSFEYNISMYITMLTIKIYPH